MNRPHSISMARVAIAVLALFVGQEARAQKAMVLNHGILSDGQTFTQATSALQQRFGSSVQVLSPNRAWTQRIGSQVSDLHAQLGAVGFTTRRPIVAGHSLGGVVSRGLVRSMDADAIVTFGAPNQGHPLVDNSWRLVEKQVLLGLALVPILDLRNNCPPELDWYTCLAMDTFAERIVEFSGVLLAGQLLVEGIPSFIDDLSPSSSAFADTINSAVGNERVLARHNVLVQMADGIFGPIPLLYEDPYQQWQVFDRFLVAGYYMLEYGMDLIATSSGSPSDPLALAGAALFTAGWELLGLGDTWSSAVGGWPHDGFVPVSAQHYPGAAVSNVVGPSHIQETRNPAIIQLIGDVARNFGAIENQPPPTDPPPSPSYWVSINGPSDMQPGSFCTWSVSTNMPYSSVEWRVNQSVVGTESTLSWSAYDSFELEVSVSDGTSNHSAALNVFVGYDAGYCNF